MRVIQLQCRSVETSACRVLSHTKAGRVLCAISGAASPSGAPTSGNRANSFVHRLGTRRLLSQRHRNMGSPVPLAFTGLLQRRHKDATRTEKKLQTTRMPQPGGKRLMLLQGASTGTEQELQQIRARPGDASVLHVEGMAKREALPTGTLSTMCGVLEGRTLHAGNTR